MRTLCVFIVVVFVVCLVFRALLFVLRLSLDLVLGSTRAKAIFAGDGDLLLLAGLQALFFCMRGLIAERTAGI